MQKNNTEKIISIIQFARKAGKITTGMDATLRSVAIGKTLLIIIAEDVSPSSRKRILNAAADFGTKYITLGTTQQFGYAIGRLKLGIIGIENKNFADGIRQLASK